MGILDSPAFWSTYGVQTETILTDGSLHFVLLGKNYKMLPLIRKNKTKFTEFLLTDTDARKCKVIVNGNQYGYVYGRISQVMAAAGPDNPADTLIQGQIVIGGDVVAGDSRPESFWFGQIAKPTNDPWNWQYTADKGDPPAGPQTLAAIGGIGPLIAGALRYGIGNKYRPGAPAGVNEPPYGQPPAPAMPYLIQRNNNTFQDASRLKPETGKTILAYCAQKRMLLVGVQPDGAGPGQTHANLAFALAERGFDSAVFLDGSDSATMMVDGELVISPGRIKNDSIDVGIGFYC